MRRINLAKWLLMAAVIFAYWRGYTFFDSTHGEIAVEYAMTCAICLVFLGKQMIKSQYLNLKMKKVDKLSGRAFEKYL